MNIICAKIKCNQTEQKIRTNARGVADFWAVLEAIGEICNLIGLADLICTFLGFFAVSGIVST